MHLEEAVRALEQQISELNTLIRLALPSSPIEQIAPFELSISTAATKGAPNARVALIEFSDFECPFCGRHALTVYPELQRRFVETGKIKYSFRHLPLEQIHPSARKAAEAAECAGKQDKFWEMHDRLFKNQQSLQRDNFIAHAQTIGLKQPEFEQCFTDGQMSAKVSEDLVDARLRSLTGTPTFLLGEIGENGIVKVTKKYQARTPSVSSSKHWIRFCSRSNDNFGRELYHESD